MNYDLILTGTSFASSFFLKKFLEKSPANVRVLVLERGLFVPHADRLKRAKEVPFGKVSFISGGAAPYLNHNPQKPWIFDASFGGSSNCWTGCTPRFMPADFKLRTTYGVGMDWPISYDDLESYICDVEAIMSISGPEETPYPMSRPYALPPHALSTVDRIMQKKYRELYISQPTARASRAGARNPCCASSICHLCPVSAKFTIENGLPDVYQDPRVTVKYGAQVLSLDIAGGLVKGVQVMEGTSTTVYQANVVALGANAIFNAHILLNSGDKNINTGRYLSEQVGYYAYVYLDNLDNVGGGTIITANGFMLHDTPKRSEAAACIIESHSDPFVRSGPGKWRKVAKFKFVFEDLPQASNRVTTGNDIHTPEVIYGGHSDYVTRGYENAKRQLNNILGDLPVEEIFLDEQPQASEAHILGTTRMGETPELGVVDKHLVHHTYRNVFVLGGGAFPAISPSNPTLILSALSLWAADKNFGS